MQPSGHTRRASCIPTLSWHCIWNSEAQSFLFHWLPQFKPIAWDGIDCFLNFFIAAIIYLSMSDSESHHSFSSIECVRNHQANFTSAPLLYIIPAFSAGVCALCKFYGGPINRMENTLIPRERFRCQGRALDLWFPCLLARKSADEIITKHMAAHGVPMLTIRTHFCV